MSTTVPTLEALLPDSIEFDSDGSSGEERGAKRQLLGDPESSGPKKRRKQTTPIKFPAPLTINECDDSEDEESLLGKNGPQDSEGKKSPLAKLLQNHPSTKDENLNNEFRCQYCSQFFDNRVTLDLHLECQHNFPPPANTSLQHQSSGNHSHGESPQTSSQIQVNEETNKMQVSDQSISPINLSAISIKNFASSWLSGHVQSQTQGDGSITLPARTNPMQGIQPCIPNTLAQFLPMPGFPLTDANQIPRAALGHLPRIFNPEAYCDLCNKEFCNKYFLKTHKANKHGIYGDPPASQPLNAESVTTVPYFPGPFSGNTVNTEATPIQDANATSQLTLPASPSIACSVCSKRFKNEDSLRRHKQKVHTDSQDQSEIQVTINPRTTPITMDDDGDTQSRQSPGGMEALFKQEYSMEQEETAFMPAPRYMSPQSMQHARDSDFNFDRLKSLGVMNPEAFCEICCKEYCNKYFLRTHKIKRHGIMIPDNERVPGNPGSAATWHQVQTSPLNLIMTESIGNGSEASDRSVDESECRPCGIRFQTMGLYQLHRQKIHENEEQKSPKPDSESGSTDQRADVISEDLQKLQTMILQLNGVESKTETSCALCGKEFDSINTLKSHMAMEHGVVSDNPVSPQPLDEKPILTGIPSAYCIMCEREYPNQDLLRKHIAEDHQPTTPTSLTPQPPQSMSVPTTPKANTPQMTERKVVSSMTPTSSYCEICNKELCNKYFMKTHMQRMHGIEIENGAQIGGVICNICNKELCSKYFLRVHKHNTHGIVEEGTTVPGVKQDNFETVTNPEESSFKPEQLSDLNNRYFTHFTEVCPICSRRFRSIKWLKAHMIGDHGKSGVEKWREVEFQYQTNQRSNGRSAGTSRATQHNSPLNIPNGQEISQHHKSDFGALGNQFLSNLFGPQADDQQVKTYRCSHCNFTTTVLPLFFLHERSHTNPQENPGLDNERNLQCPICSLSFSQPDVFQRHLITQHAFPGVFSQFPMPILNNIRHGPVEKVNDHQEKDFNDMKEDTRQSSPQTVNDSDKSNVKKESAVQVMPQGAYKCAQCGFATANLNRIKKHVKKDHKSIGDPAETVIAELSKTLKDVANKHKVPASYAMPQDMALNPENTIMQPFMIEEQETSRDGEEVNLTRRFAPALVYLPVQSRVNSSLTTCFTLNPA